MGEIPAIANLSVFTRADLATSLFIANQNIQAAIGVGAVVSVDSVDTAAVTIVGSEVVNDVSHQLVNTNEIIIATDDAVHFPAVENSSQSVSSAAVVIDDTPVTDAVDDIDTSSAAVVVAVTVSGSGTLSGYDIIQTNTPQCVEKI